MLSFLTQQLRNVRGLGTVPGIIALILWGFALITLQVDTAFPAFADSKAYRILYTDYETAKSVLSTVAAASITTLGLVYSIVLVVFTTAAGNIGPRLLQRFTSDRVNQFTAGLFGGTFLFSLTVLHQTDPNFVPAFSIACTFLFAGLSVLQLIYFVHSASVSVTVDEEVTEIASNLETEVNCLINNEERDKYSEEVPDIHASGPVVEATKSGYIADLNIEALVEYGRKHDVFINLLHGQGAFVVAGQDIVQLSKQVSGSGNEDWEQNIRDAIGFSANRSPDSDVEFSINLLIEISLRALSPGVNDTFTAIACIDRISSALLLPVKKGLRDHIRADKDRVPRLHIPGLTVDDLLNTAFHPLRRASAGNVLMTKHILDALARLHEVGNAEAQDVLQKHAKLILELSKKSGLVSEDIAFISNRHKSLMGSV